MKSLETVMKGSSSKDVPAKVETPDPEPVRGEVDEVQKSPDTESEPAPAKVEAPKGDTKASSPEAKHESPTIPIATFKDVERQLQAAKRQLKEREEKDKQPPPKSPDVLEDPEGFKKQLKDEAASEILDSRIALSEDFMKSATPDFATVMGTDDQGNHQAWIDLAKSQPHLTQQFFNAPNPARFAYETVKRHKALADIGDPLTARERIKAEVKAEMEAEQKAKAETAKRPEIPDTLADEPSKSPRKGPEYSGPKPLGEIMGKKDKK